MEPQPPVSDADQPRRRRRPAAPTQDAQGSAIKGAILVAVAVAIGLILLRDDGATTAQVSVGAEDDPSAAVDDDTSTTTASTTTAPVRAPAEVKVLVANGSNTDGAAGSQTTELEALGYVTASPTNAELVTASVVYFTEGYQPEARVLAESIGLTADAVQALPTPAPVDDMQLSNVLLVIGPDLASAG